MGGNAYGCFAAQSSSSVMFSDLNNPEWRTVTPDCLLFVVAALVEDDVALSRVDCIIHQPVCPVGAESF